MPHPRNDLLLAAGILAAAGYVGTDLLGGFAYPGYSFRAQAVSELFAIGAPTQRLVTLLFSTSSLLLLLFSAGIWNVAGKQRLLRVLALMFTGSAVVGLLIWNAFPMHMRGVAPTFTDTMHLVLATNPFVLATLGVTIAAFPGRFRAFTIATVLILVLSAIPAFSYAPALKMNQPTPWLGAAERAAQYTYEVWQVGLAWLLKRNSRSRWREG